ncbi:T9SS type A sorting domain-containing protein [Chitinophagaceae bacterium MMS25-I14]
MKIINTLLLLLIYPLIYHAKAQTVISSCTAPDSIVNKCKYNANELVVRMSYDNNTSYKDSILIDPSRIDTFVRAFVAIYNAYSLPVRDTIINYRHIGAFPTIEISQLYLICDTSLQWARNLVNHVVPCGYQPIDSLINVFHLSIYTSSGNWIQLQADSNYYNMPKMISLFQALPGVQYAAVPTSQNWGDDVTATITPNFVNIVYRYNFLHYWKFHVFYDCTVQYVSSWRDGDPDPSGINEIKAGTIEFYPNPAKQYLYLKHEQGIQMVYITIYALDGRTLCEGKLQNTNAINVQNLTPGSYFIRLNTIKGESIINFIKE